MSPMVQIRGASPPARHMVPTSVLPPKSVENNVPSWPLEKVSLSGGSVLRGNSEVGGGGPGNDWRKSYEDLQTLFQQSTSSWNSQRAALESSLKETLDRCKRFEQDAAELQQQQLQQKQGQRVPMTGPLDPASVAGAASIEDLRRQVTELSRENAQWRQVNDERVAVELIFFDQVKPLLERFGRSLPGGGLLTTTATLASPQVARANFGEVATVFANVSDASRDYPLLSVVAGAFSQAIDGGETALESWLASSKLSADDRIRLETAGELLPCCRRVAALKSHGNTQSSAIEATPIHAIPLYKPDKKDPVDCILAARLLRLGFVGQTPSPSPSFVRVGPGTYLFGSKQMPVQCRIDSDGRMLVRRPMRLRWQQSPAETDGEVSGAVSGVEDDSCGPADTVEVELGAFLAEDTPALQAPPPVTGPLAPEMIKLR